MYYPVTDYIALALIISFLFLTLFICLLCLKHESEILQLRKALNEARLERDILKKATVDSIGQRNSYVKTWGCGGFLNETNIYSRGKSLCF